MPPKKGVFTYSINPELYARSHKPAMTIAMGMKGSHASSLCWSDQVKKEEAIRRHWATKYNFEELQEAEALQALERTQARDAARHEAYVNQSNNPDIHTLLYRKRHSMVSAAPASTLSPAVAGNELNSSTATPPPSASSAEASSTDGTPSRRVRRATDEYLKARYNHCTMQQRYPEGPATAAQVVGWKAATSSSSSSATAARTATHHRSAGAYRKPEDDDHAALLGFDYTPK
ncbi:hypothetical protein ABL78_2507 [Leptomonas seymouri]|uniref:Uncharacterized protein n=1 Tax=Leptomonas seymouri TaxID=5684 RepID=A0A0N1I7F5_LEPSE|nr:hypothetical protein ABL78_2507 [Leptomonas seymouri]|eukprot:KPI88388.1 hypothetical protein ABL78_2507 [Leptomonas seymouri]